jgi:hypothetical protein
VDELIGFTATNSFPAASDNGTLLGQFVDAFWGTPWQALFSGRGTLSSTPASTGLTTICIA